MDSKFKAGDVLKFEDGMRAIVASGYPQATNSNEYLYYLWSWYKGAIDWDSWSESELVNKVKIIDHIDISSVVGHEQYKGNSSFFNFSGSNFAGYGDLVFRAKIDEGTIEFETVDKNIRELQKEIDILKSKVNLLLDRTARLMSR